MTYKYRPDDKILSDVEIEVSKQLTKQLFDDHRHTTVYYRGDHSGPISRPVANALDEMKKSYTLMLDDQRSLYEVNTPEFADFILPVTVIARTPEEAFDVVKKYGWPETMLLDYDLSVTSQQTACAFLTSLISSLLEGSLESPNRIIPYGVISTHVRRFDLYKFADELNDYISSDKPIKRC